MALSVVHKGRVLGSTLIVRIDSVTLKVTNFSFGMFDYQCEFSSLWYIEKRLIHFYFLESWKPYFFSVFTSFLKMYVRVLIPTYIDRDGKIDGPETWENVGFILCSNQLKCVAVEYTQSLDHSILFL